MKPILSMKKILELQEDINRTSRASVGLLYQIHEFEDMVRVFNQFFQPGYDPDFEGATGSNPESYLGIVKSCTQAIWESSTLLTKCSQENRLLNNLYMFATPNPAIIGSEDYLSYFDGAERIGEKWCRFFSERSVEGTITPLPGTLVQIEDVTSLVEFMAMLAEQLGVLPSAEQSRSTFDIDDAGAQLVKEHQRAWLLAANNYDGFTFDFEAFTIIDSKPHKKRDMEICILIAIALKVKYPDWTDKKIAEQVDIPPSTLSRNEEYKSSKDRIEQTVKSQSSFHSGHRTKNEDGLSDVEGFDDSNDPKDGNYD